VTATPLTAFIERVRIEVNEALERFLPAAPACPSIVADAMRYSVFAGGKRLRPVLALAAADAVSRSAEGRRPLAGLARDAAQSREGNMAEGLSPAMMLALPAACALELIHTYSLIHDDLPAMDDDTLRRGRPTLHVVYGEGIAILAGDGLHAEAFSLLAREPIGGDPSLAARKLHVLHVVAEAAGARGMVGGQAIDLQAAGQAPGRAITLDADGLRQMHARKTGALIRASAVSGAIMSDASHAIVAAIDCYAENVGLAFQIVDDILDVEGDPALLGKTAGKDAAGAKPTYPALFGLDRSRALAAECLDRARGAVTDAGLGDSWLEPIARWVIERKH
jgi:geranylgeranyl pyrophosphate synthase